MSLKYSLALMMTMLLLTDQASLTSRSLVCQTFLGRSKTPQTFHLHLSEVGQTVIHPSQDLTLLERRAALTIIVLNFIIGLSYRILLIKNVLKTRSLTLYNIMTAFEECPKMIGAVAFTMICGSSLVLNEPVYQHIGEPSCRIFTGLFVLGIVHWWTGGLGMALLRWLVIKYSTKLKIRERTLAVLISLTTLAFSVRSSYVVMNTQRRNFDPMNLCLGRSEDFAIVLFDYSLETSLLYGSHMLTILRIVAFLMFFAEVGLYASIWHYLKENDKAIAPYLNKDVVNHRKRKNIINSQWKFNKEERKSYH